MSVVIGIDIGGSTTKIVGFQKHAGERKLLSPLFVSADDPVTSMYGAFGKFLSENNLSLPEIEKVMMTGVGSSYFQHSVYDLPCEVVEEFRSIGLGGLYLSGLPRALTVSLGTGTAVVYAEDGRPMEYLGGTGVGGGTLLGLARQMLRIDNIKHLLQLAEGGDLSKIDLRISDMSKKDTLSAMPMELTAANFGKMSDMASREDIALGILNMVYETIAMVSMFAARSKGVKDIILTGNMAVTDYAKQLFPRLSSMFNLNFMIPDMAQFATAIGTALCG